jgi:hypothetical protein
VTYTRAYGFHEKDVTVKIITGLLATSLSAAAVAEIPEPAGQGVSESIQTLVDTPSPYAVSPTEVRAIQIKKAIAFQVWQSSIKTDREIAIDKLREILERTQRRLPTPPELLIGPPNSAAALQGVMIPKSLYSWSNGRPLYSGKYSFFNEYTGKIYGRPHSHTLRQWDDESRRCKGFLSVSSSEESKRDVENCFVAKDFRLEMLAGRYAEYRYLRSLSLITTLIRKDETHSCMASVYKKNLWITAKHCLPDPAIDYGIYILLPDGSRLITRDDVTPCTKPRCDTATIKATTPDVPEMAILNITPDLNGLRPDTNIFIPGMVQSSSVSKNIDRKSLEESIMWSDFGKGYCRIRNVYHGCLSHTCSSIEGWSGSPVYAFEGDQIKLLGIHSGADVNKVSCINKGDKVPTNYATLKPLYEGL